MGTHNMASTDALYFDGYAPGEAQELRNRGLTVHEVANGESVPPTKLDPVLRGPKLNPAQYRLLVHNLASCDTRPSTSPESYTALSDASLYEACIANFVPPKAIFDLRDSAQAAQQIAKLKNWRKVFIRSELGSAAKAAGLDACMIEDFHPTEIHKKLKTLRDTFPNAERVIARRVEVIKTVRGKQSEGRFVVVGDRLAYMDHCELDDAHSVDQFYAQNSPRAAEVVAAFLRGGISGDYFVDLAEKADGGWFVVEVKPLFNGTIRNVGNFAAILLARREHRAPFDG